MQDRRLLCFLTRDEVPSTATTTITTNKFVKAVYMPWHSSTVNNQCCFALDALDSNGDSLTDLFSGDVDSYNVALYYGSSPSNYQVYDRNSWDYYGNFYQNQVLYFGSYIQPEMLVGWNHYYPIPLILGASPGSSSGTFANPASSYSGWRRDVDTKPIFGVEQSLVYIKVDLSAISVQQQYSENPHVWDRFKITAKSGTNNSNCPIYVEYLD